MRDKLKFYKPNFNKHSEFGDAIIQLKNGDIGSLSKKDYKKVKNFFKKIKTYGEQDYQIGNVVVDDIITSPKIYSEIKDIYAISSIIGNKDVPEVGDILAYNSLIEESAVFNFEDCYNLDSSWEIKGIEGIDTFDSEQEGLKKISALDVTFYVSPEDYDKLNSNWK